MVWVPVTLVMLPSITIIGVALPMFTSITFWQDDNASSNRGLYISRSLRTVHQNLKFQVTDGIIPNRLVSTASVCGGLVALSRKMTLYGFLRLYTLYKLNVQLE